MEEEKHLNANANRKSHQEFYNKPLQDSPTPNNKCLVYILLAVVLLSLAFLVFGLVLLRINAPSLKLQNVVVNDLRYQPPSLNFTMLLLLRLHNPNFARFNFRKGTAALLYGNATIAAADIPDGGVGRREGRNVNTTLKVTAAINRRDAELGLVKLTSLAEVRGEVRVVRVVHRYRTAVMNCTVDLNLTSQTVHRLSC